MISLGSILGGLLRLTESWFSRRYPPVLVTLCQRGERAAALVAAFAQPIFVRSLDFEILGKDVHDSVALNQMITPNGQIEAFLPRKITSAFVLTQDISVAANYRTASGREAQTPKLVFNVLGDGSRVGNISNEGKHLSWTNCPSCHESVMFTNRGVSTTRALAKRRKGFEKDLRKTCPDHESSRVKFWI